MVVFFSKKEVAIQKLWSYSCLSKTPQYTSKGSPYMGNHGIQENSSWLLLGPTESNQGVEQWYVVYERILVHYFVLLTIIVGHLHIRTKEGPIFEWIWVYASTWEGGCRPYWSQHPNWQKLCGDNFMCDIDFDLLSTIYFQ